MKRYVIVMPVNDPRIVETWSRYNQESGLPPHITLVRPFAASTINGVVAEVKSLTSKHDSLTIRTLGADVFHNEDDVVFLHVEPSPELCELQRAINAAIAEITTFTSRSYGSTLHITIAKKPRGQGQKVVDELPTNWRIMFHCVSLGVYLKEGTDPWREISSFPLIRAGASS